jgi:hypothetical protein
MLRHPLIWYREMLSPTGRWVFWMVVGFVFASAGAWFIWSDPSPQATWQESFRAAAPAMSIIVAILGFGTAVGSLVNNGKRDRVLRTIEAWSHFSDSILMTYRKDVASVLGEAAITAPVAKSLATEGKTGAFAKPDGNEATIEEIREVRKRTREVLNGMERLGTGVDLGAYDVETISYLGRNKCTRVYKYVEQYIYAVRDLGQPSAFNEAQVLSDRLERFEIVKKRSGLARKRSDVDGRIARAHNRRWE